MLTTTVYQQLRDFTIFEDLSDDALMELERHCQYIELQAGETLFQQNDPSDALYLLEAGQIHITRQYPDGDEVILATAIPYYAIGDLSMLVSRPHVAAISAVTDCTLIAIERQAFFEVCERFPDIAVQVILYLARRLYRLNLQVREDAISSVTARVASVIWLLSGGEVGEIKARLQVSYVARAIAMDFDTVKRILEDWDKAGYITYAGGQVKIHDIDTIRNIAEYQDLHVRTNELYPWTGFSPGSR